MEVIYSKVFEAGLNETALQVGSGGLAVLSTPSMITYMEHTAYDYCQQLLAEIDSDTTVGVFLEVHHLKASRVPCKVQVDLIQVQATDREVALTLQAKVEDQIIGQAVHRRALVDSQRFMARLNQ